MQLQSSNLIHYCLTYHVHHQHSPLWCQANGFRHQDLSQQVHLLCCRIRYHPKSIHSISCICKNTKGLLLSHGSNSKWSYSFSNVLLHKQCVVAQNSLLHKERAMPSPPPKKKKKFITVCNKNDHTSPHPSGVT